MLGQSRLSSAANGPADEANSPAALLRDLSLRLPELGITRLARQSGLDRTGIACYAAIRPNSATIATHQGKGIDDVSAQISAIMEAAEYAVAEAPETPTRRLSIADARAAGLPLLDVTPQLPRDRPPDESAAVLWVEGRDVATAGTVLVPYDAVVLGTPPADFPGLAQSTNGLAAGTGFEGALLHALCELVERDAVCLWGFKSDAAARATAIAPGAFADPDIDALSRRIAGAGYRLRLFDQTGSTAIPAIYAVLSAGDDPDRHFEVATGASAHPVAAVAARRAIVEAAQTRIALIAGARDDIEEAGYDQALSRSLAVLTEDGAADRPPPAGLPAGATQRELLDFVLAGLARAGLGQVIAVPLGGARIGIHVVKAFVPGLEDRLTNRNWRAGPRATAAMLGFL